MDNTIIKKLVETAIEARERSYTPFSGFAVGAALLAPDGKVIPGCNIECSGYSSTCCAERTAIFKAVSEGYRSFEAVAVVGGKAGKPISELCAPCGVCRQVLAEFSEPENFTVILASSPEEWETYTLAQLLPLAFKDDKK